MPITGDGLSLLDEAVEIATQSPGPTLWSEFFQLKGELLLALSTNNAAAAVRLQRCRQAELSVSWSAS